MTSKSHTKPNLFIVGEPKSGTTALYYMLKQHPEIYLCEPKEPDFFATDLREESDEFYGREEYFPYRSEKEYLQLFEEANEEKIVGEGSTEYIYSEDAAANIAEFSPDAKIIIMLRDPLTFLPAMYSELYKSSKEDIPERIVAIKKRTERESFPPRVAVPSYLDYEERVRYAKHIKRFFKHFPAERIKIIIYEDFKQDNYRTYAEVLEFLSLEDYEPERVVTNTNKRTRSKKIKKIIDSKATWFVLRKISGTKLYQWLAELYFRMFFTAKKRKPLTQKERTYIHDLSQDTKKNVIRLLRREGFEEYEKVEELWT